MVLKSWSVGLALTVTLFLISTFGNHTPLGITFVLLVPPLVLAEFVRTTIGEKSSSWLIHYSLLIFFGSVFYGFLAFLVFRHRSRKHDSIVTHSGSGSDIS